MLSDPEFRQILDALDRPWSGFRKVRKGVKKRLRRHMVALGCNSAEAYLAMIGGDESVRASSEACLTITISRFYRDRQLWERLAEHTLVELSRRFPGDLRAWSAGCANGEEPYSLAMLWEEVRQAMSSLPALSILATDGQEDCLAKARQGIYPLSSLKEVPTAHRQAWFLRVPGSKQWRVDDHLERRIRWQHHQLLDASPPGPFHLILLRNNLLTYYQGPTLEAAFGRITEQLAPGGVLAIGSHERLPRSAARWERDAACPWIYCRKA